MFIHYFRVNPHVMEAKGSIPYWMIAERLGVHENTVRNWMKNELSQEKKIRVLAAIAEIKRDLKVVQ